MDIKKRILKIYNNYSIECYHSLISLKSTAYAVAATHFK